MNLIDPSNPILFTPARVPSDEDITMHAKTTVPAMLKLMREKRGIGLSAVQVGLDLRLFVTGYKAFPVCFNPSFTEGVADGHTSKPEGCLSRPGFHTYVRRADSINAAWTDAEGQSNIAILQGMEARVFAHETDHCNGRCIFPRPSRVVVLA